LRTQLISMMEYTVSDKSFVLDDYSSGSRAVYCAVNNDKKSFCYYEPDKPPGAEPRCDFLLVCLSDHIVRFIELKAILKDYGGCCGNTWAHAFHQLFATYYAYYGFIDHEKDIVKMILCTSMVKRSRAKLEHYRYYKKIRECNITPQILYADQEDVV